MTNNQMRKWWTGATNKVCRMMRTGELPQTKKQGRRVLLQAYPHKLQKSRVRKALTPLLENSHDWMPF